MNTWWTMKKTFEQCLREQHDLNVSCHVQITDCHRIRSVRGKKKPISPIFFPLRTPRLLSGPTVRHSRPAAVLQDRLPWNCPTADRPLRLRSEEHTSELQSRGL